MGIVAEDEFRELRRILRMNKITENITSQCSNVRNKAIMGSVQNP